MDTLPDPSKLQTFGHAAAGHDGVLTDEDHTLIIKPCTKAEIDFYNHANSHFPSLAQFMPQFMGTLQLGNKQDSEDVTDSTDPSDVALRLKGKPIDSDTSIVLSDVTAGFEKPNVLDLKLGARLWAEDAPVAKRERLDDVAGNTTSKPLGFRVAGMRVWQGKGQETPATTISENIKLDTDTNYLVYNKVYGRKLTTGTVAEGFRNYLNLYDQSEAAQARAKRLLAHIIRELTDIRDVLSSLETRMYSASVLLVYEGEPEAYAAAKDLEDARIEFERSMLQNFAMEMDGGSSMSATATEDARFADADDVGGDDEEMDEDDEDDDDEEEDEISEPKTYAVKLIDFAHATATPGQGPDENALHGVRSILDIVKRLAEELN